ncbi:putative integral membrane protein [Dactylonectria macrodidyma]|uniref:Integral membrane protein n=1 Tax=Dactylonectria macrodidyma TaxID=307937 RepID=A0A9P9FWR4_9HYPO|nr:putative integral membrane protein [Dactylonectria macrodidyma]
MNAMRSATKNGTMTLCGAPDRRASTNLRAITTSFAIISSLFVIQRFAFRLYTRLGLGPDDWVALLAGVFTTAANCLVLYGLIPSGIGSDVWVLNFSQIYDFGMFFVICEIVYFADIALLKLSLLFFFLRIFPAAGIRRVLWATMAIIGAFGFAFVFAAIFQCQPVSFSWKSWDGEHLRQCIDVNAMAWANATISIALDIWMLAIPLAQVRALHLNLKKKIAVAAMFCVGTFVTIVSILRLHSLVKFGTASENPTRDYYAAGLWSVVELNVGLICICLPSFRQFVIRLFPSIDSRITKYQVSSGGHSSASNRRGQSRGKEGSDTNAYLGPEGSRGIGGSDSVLSDHDEIMLVETAHLDNKSARSAASMLSMT